MNLADLTAPAAPGYTHHVSSIIAEVAEVYDTRPKHRKWAKFLAETFSAMVRQ